MSNVIQVLAQMGSDARLQNESAISDLLTSADLEAGLTEAIVSKDIISLERQLGVCPDIVCAIGVPSEDDDDEEKTDEKDDNDSTEETSHRVIGF